MQSVVGIFRSCALAESAVQGLVNHGVPRQSIIFLSTQCPGELGGQEIERQLDEVPTTDAEPDGMGKGIGAGLWAQRWVRARDWRVEQQ
jgi:hypothetical protein